ncbi:MAG TPA: hypothetical protein PK416_10990, partial [Thermodesulfobacteriota bacterium]|nr:hypothetical protein [Thermodesulfobacteriota bacterium]
MIAPYFTDEEGAPAPLRETLSRRVRFEEVDPLGIVCHHISILPMKVPIRNLESKSIHNNRHHTIFR